ncbi:hypothetical protein PV646_33570 [Streptomyces sp. ID05-26A]|nr:hypothetical protein [Streptomyces sp. ID05-26A]
MSQPVAGRLRQHRPLAQREGRGHLGVAAQRVERFDSAHEREREDLAEKRGIVVTGVRPGQVVL